MFIVAAAAVAAVSWTKANTILQVLVYFCMLVGFLWSASVVFKKWMKHLADGLNERLDGIQTTVDAELRHNGGSSLKDFARDAKVGTEKLQARMDVLESAFVAHTHAVDDGKPDLKVVQA